MRFDPRNNMPDTTPGSVASLWRYPVKSMLGEELSATEVTEQGLLGDRAYAVVDSADGKAATAKNPRNGRHSTRSLAPLECSANH